MVSIVIIEDIPLIRNSIGAYLGSQPDFNMVGAYGSVEDYLATVDQATPDVILSDIGLPGMNGIEGIRIFKQKFPQVEVIMLTIFQDEANIFKALCAGASGYLLKSTPMSELKESIINITLGEVPLSKAVARKVLEHFNPTRTYGNNDELTSKEQQVLQSLIDGLSYKNIALRLGVGLETVRSHIKNIYKKLHVANKGEAIKVGAKLIRS